LDFIFGVFRETIEGSFLRRGERFNNGRSAFPRPVDLDVMCCSEKYQTLNPHIGIIFPVGLEAVWRVLEMLPHPLLKYRIQLYE